jgi:hypothetical protein
MTETSLDHLRAAYGHLQREWYAAVQARPICGDDLFRIHTDMELLKAAMEMEEEP